MSSSGMLFLVTLLVSYAPLPALGDLGTALRRSAVQGSAVLPASAPMSSSVVIPLTRTKARSGSAQEADFYVGEIDVGHPAQRLRVVFDTSSGHLLLPHRACHNATCMEHRRYSPWESMTSMDVNIQGDRVQKNNRLARGQGMRDGVNLGFTQSDLGEGEVHAVVVRDSVCVGDGVVNDQACVDMAILAATSMEEKPFRYMPSDGIVGLGLAGLSSSPICSFFGRLLGGSTNVLPHFGIALTAERGELHLGGHDLARLASPLRWFPVDHPESGFWQVAIQAVRVGNVTVDDCQRGCHGIIDSAVSRLGVQANKMPAMRSALKAVHAMLGECAGPDLTFDLGGMELTLRAKDYADSHCNPLLGSLDLQEPEFVGVYALGATLLRSYYAAFDWEDLRLGFAPLNMKDQPSVRSEVIPESLAGVLLV